MFIRIHTLGAVLLAAAPSSAQSAAAAVAPAPVRPAAAPASSTLTRDADGHVTVHATRIRQPIEVDGRLDDEVYGNVPPLTELIQQEPQAGSPISEKTEIWVLFDDDN